jgi:hypothetical protein
MSFSSDDVLKSVVSKTEKTSAAFIKELMRRSVVYQLERTGESMIELQDVECALEELLVSGGSLNLMLLGARRDGQGKPTDIGLSGTGECRSDQAR